MHFFTPSSTSLHPHCTHSYSCTCDLWGHYTGGSLFLHIGKTHAQRFCANRFKTSRVKPGPHTPHTHTVRQWECCDWDRDTRDLFKATSPVEPELLETMTLILLLSWCTNLSAVSFVYSFSKHTLAYPSQLTVGERQAMPPITGVTSSVVYILLPHDLMWTQ